MSSNAEWFIAVDGQTVGPMTIDELVSKLQGTNGSDGLIFGPGMSEWKPASQVSEVSSRMLGDAPPIPAPPGVTAQTQRVCDEIDYEIHGEEMQYVEITLDPGEMVMGEAGVMMYMSDGIKMETVFGDPSAQDEGVMGKIFSAGKRVLTGESLFVTTFTAAGRGQDRVGFSAPYPGKLIPLHMNELGGEIICQKDSFVCAARGTKINIAFRKKIGVGLFGGEGFVMQRINGDGITIIHAGGNIMMRDLAAGETLRVDTGCLVAMQPSVDYDVQLVGGIKNTLFGGEGLFFATLRGPGRVWLQTLPFSRFVGRIASTLPSSRGGGKGEGSILGGIGGMLGGD